MSTVPSLKPAEVLRKLRHAGFRVDHVTGSHYVLLHSDGRRTVVPYHAGRDVKPGVLRAIIQQTGMTTADFLAL